MRSASSRAPVHRLVHAHHRLNRSRGRQCHRPLGLLSLGEDQAAPGVVEHEADFRIGPLRVDGHAGQSNGLHPQLALEVLGAILHPKTRPVAQTQSKTGSELVGQRPAVCGQLAIRAVAVLLGEHRQLVGPDMAEVPDDIVKSRHRQAD